MLMVLALLVLHRLEMRLLHTRPIRSGSLDALMNRHGKGRRSHSMSRVASVVGDAAL